MASRRSINKDDGYYRRVIQKSWPKFLDDLDTKSIIDLFEKRKYVPVYQIRDIKDMQLLSERTRAILGMVSIGGRKGYREFKDFLIETQQVHLAEYLDEKDAELEEEIRMAGEQEQVIPARTSPTETVSRYDDQASNATVPLDPEGPYQSGSLPPEGAISQNFPSLPAPSGHATLPRAEGDFFTGAVGRVEGNQESIHSILFPNAFGDTRKQGQYESNIPAVDKSNSMSSSASPVARSSSGNDIIYSRRPFEIENTTDAVHRSSEEVKGNNQGPHNQQQPASYDTTNPLVERLKNDKLGEPKNQRSDTVLKQISTDSNQKDETDSNRNPPAMSHSGLSVKREKNPNIEPQLAHHDGRLFTPNVKVFKDLIDSSHSQTKKGGFGEVFFITDKLKIPNWKIPVVVKRITCNNDSRHKMMSITNEKLASRTMHFAIVPLLAMKEDLQDNMFYFLTPYLEKGDLADAIKHDTENMKAGNTVLLKATDRVRIIFQINSGLQYLHEPIPGFRGTIVHMDLRTMNIVLDCNLNARIIDFGLAREMKGTDTSISLQTKSELTGAKGYFQSTQNFKLTTKEDYYNFGIVIRELLTGKPAYDSNIPEYQQLRKLDRDNVSSDIQGIWKKPSPKDAKALNNIADQCLKKKEGQGTELKDVCEKFMRDKNIEKWVRGKASGEVDVKCEMCMVNPTVQMQNVVYGHKKECICHMKICISCIRNSFYNPMKCHSCGSDLQSIIGHGWGAVIIAGNDTTNGGKWAKTFSKEISDIHDAITSKCPLVMGISKENTRVVQPANPGESGEMLPMIDQAFDDLQGKGDINTLLIYFSGHHYQDKGFQLGNETEFLTVEKLQEKMENFSKSYTSKELRSDYNSSRRFMVFFDCCASPGVTLPNLKDTKDYSILQINSCRSFQTADADENIGSFFTKFFIQALTRRAFQQKCINNGCDERNCLLGEFVTAQELFEYISNHIRDYSESSHQTTLQQPVKFEHNALLHDLLIAYNIDFLVDIEFKVKGHEEKYSVQHQIYPDLKSLRLHLFEKLIEKLKPDHKLDVTHYPDFEESLCIEIDQGPNETEELDSIEKVMGAWNSKRELSVSFRIPVKICRGMVWIDTPVEKIQNTVVDPKLKPEQESKDAFTKMSLSYTLVDKIIEDMEETDDEEVKTLRSCLIDMRQGINNAKTVCKGKDTKVHFIFPKQSLDFMCFQVTGLEKKETL